MTPTTTTDIYGHRGHPRTLKELTDIALARLLLRRMWYLQDERGAASGMSTGREPRNRLLEAAMHLLPLQPIARRLDLEMLPFEAIAAEVARRRSFHGKAPERPYTHRPPLSDIGDIELAALLLRTLKSVYRNAKRHDFRDRLRDERELLDEALSLYPPQRAIPKPLPWKTEDIVAEADRRRFAPLLKH